MVSAGFQGTKPSSSCAFRIVGGRLGEARRRQWDRCPGHNGMSQGAAEPGVFRHTWNGDHVTGQGWGSWAKCWGLWAAELFWCLENSEENDPGTQSGRNLKRWMRSLLRWKIRQDIRQRSPDLCSRQMRVEGVLEWAEWKSKWIQIFGNTALLMERVIWGMRSDKSTAII